MLRTLHSGCYWYFWSRGGGEKAMWYLFAFLLGFAVFYLGWQIGYRAGFQVGQMFPRVDSFD